jgi:hypothetical protein
VCQTPKAWKPWGLGGMDVELYGPVEGREVEGAADWVGRTLHAGDWAGQGVEAQWLGLTDVELNVCKTRSPNSTCRGLDNFEPSPARQGLEALGFAVVGLGGPVEGRHAWMLGQGCRGGAKVVVVVTVGSRPKRVEPSGQLAEHCVDTLRGDGETCPDQTAQATQTGPSESGGHTQRPIATGELARGRPIRR